MLKGRGPLIPQRVSTVVLKVRFGRVQEIGIADRSLTRTRAQQSALMHSWRGAY